MNHFDESIFKSKVTNFDEMCLAVFQFQYKHNQPYKSYCHFLGINDASAIKSIQNIPFLPIEIFKKQAVKSFEPNAEKVFFSSATGGIGQSSHHVFSLELYRESFISTFESQFGSVQNCAILGLLPSYLEREGSSLIYMVQHLMQLSGHPLNGFFLYEHQTLHDRILQLESKEKPYYIFGVSFALLDFAEKFPIPLKHGKVIETGGMKGRKKEMTKIELYKELSNAFQTQNIFSEYGMTELMSQAYANIDGKYRCPAWMQVQIVDTSDPFTQMPNERVGSIRVIDLANKYSCAFIQTSDLGKKHTDGTFEVIGRLDNSDLRGCSLLVV
jgi:phenylacetate-coenzyme A ligase PaaK-like adenylate-forming protein